MSFLPTLKSGILSVLIPSFLYVELHNYLNVIYHKRLSETGRLMRSRFNALAKSNHVPWRENYSRRDRRTEGSEQLDNKKGKERD